MMHWRNLVLLPCMHMAALAGALEESPLWIKSSGGASCTSACANRGGCLEGFWPQDEGEFNEILDSIGFQCVGVQEGGAKYDPSTDGRYCGFRSDGEDNDPKCDAQGDAGTYRFCPCATEKEL
eukprot:gnl/TRDRNA2_/TRDRNA2_181727_c0_seq1.p1 gnl/TRDRNA2_/TRDRNA2_181727_c0~~gnl/TRDRNA2_/TRDRNA2_181727_c0_seq1.p1  ORF type:complete len:123 (-),score=16.43 gnl/TRDRNA2_/TRDRNA2_181727_c0_seq1:56-424(-)